MFLILSFIIAAELTSSLNFSGDLTMKHPRPGALFGVDFATYVKEHNTDIPFIIRKCTAEIEEMGITLKVWYC